LAGCKEEGYQEAKGEVKAKFSLPTGLAVLRDPQTGAQSLIVADQYNHRLRRIDLTTGLPFLFAEMQH
jgi:hypothetical protein